MRTSTSPQELKRAEVLSRVKDGTLTLGQTAAHILRAWIARYGVPQALYTDWKTVYLREPTDADLVAGTRR